MGALVSFFWRQFNQKVENIYYKCLVHICTVNWSYSKHTNELFETSICNFLISSTAYMIHRDIIGSGMCPELNFRSRILKFRLRLQKPRSFEASVGYIVIIFIIFLIIFIIMFLIIPTIFFNNIFSSFLAAFLYSKKNAKKSKKDNSKDNSC